MPSLFWLVWLIGFSFINPAQCSSSSVTAAQNLQVKVTVHSRFCTRHFSLLFLFHFFPRYFFSPPESNSLQVLLHILGFYFSTFKQLLRRHKKTQRSTWSFSDTFGDKCEFQLRFFLNLRPTSKCSHGALASSGAITASQFFNQKCVFFSEWLNLILLQKKKTPAGTSPIIPPVLFFLNDKNWFYMKIFLYAVWHNIAFSQCCRQNHLNQRPTLWFDTQPSLLCTFVFRTRLVLQGFTSIWLPFKSKTAFHWRIVVFFVVVVGFFLHAMRVFHTLA